MRALLKKSKPLIQQITSNTNSNPIEKEQQKVQKIRKSSSSVQDPECSKKQSLNNQMAKLSTKQKFNSEQEIKKQITPSQSTKQILPANKQISKEQLINNIFDQLTKQISQQILQRSEVQPQKKEERDKQVQVVDCVQMIQQLYEQLPFQAHNTSIHRTINETLRTGLLQILPKIFLQKLDPYLVQQLKTRSRKANDLLKITHQYLRKHGELPKLDKVQLAPLKIKFECQIPLKMRFTKGDFGDLVEKKQVVYKKIQ